MENIKIRKHILAVALVAGSISSASAASYGNGGSNYTSNLGAIDYPNTDRTNFDAAGRYRSGIQNAIDDAAADGGGTANMANKTWRIGAPINPKRKVRLRGSDTIDTKLQRNFTPTSSQALILHDTRNDQSGSVNDSEISTCQLDGNYTVNFLKNNVTFHGIYYNNKDTSDFHYRTLFNKLKIKRFNVGILLGGLRHLTLLDSNLDQNGASNLAHNWYSRRVGNCRMKRSTAQRALAGSGVKMTGGTSSFSWESRTIHIEDSTFKNNHRINYNSNANGYVRINDSNFTGSSTLAGIWLGYQGSGSNRNINYGTDIYNNIVEDNEGDGIFGDYCDTTWIRGNRCRDNDDNDYATLEVTNWNSDNNNN